MVIRPGKESIKRYFGNGSCWGIACEYIYQETPRGTADAVLCGKDWTKNEPFVMAWGDTILLDSSFPRAYRSPALSRLCKILASQDCQIALLVEFLNSRRSSINQQKFQYFLTPAMSSQRRSLPKSFQVSGVQRVAIDDEAIVGIPVAMPRWVLTPEIFAYLEALRDKDQGEELHLTDALHDFLNDGHRVWALGLQRHERRFDIGTPEDYEAARTFVESGLMHSHYERRDSLLVKG